MQQLNDEQIELIEREIRRIKTTNSVFNIIKDVLQLLTEEIKSLKNSDVKVVHQLKSVEPPNATNSFLGENPQPDRKEIPLPPPPKFKSVDGPDPRTRSARGSMNDGLDDLITSLKGDKK